jgi:hypothetical protein
MKMNKRTPQELEALRERWLAGPYWALEDTEGFEAHRSELREFRLKTHAEDERKRHERRIKFFNEFPGEKPTRHAKLADLPRRRTDTQ